MFTFAGILLALKRVGYFVKDNWRSVAAVVGTIFLLILVVTVFRSCGSKPAKLNEAEIQRGEQAIKEQNRKELVEILTAAEVREKAIDANLANAKADTLNSFEAARTRYGQMSIDELQTEFDRGK